jgi:hypothetical protein
MSESSSSRSSRFLPTMLVAGTAMSLLLQLVALVPRGSSFVVPHPNSRRLDRSTATTTMVLSETRGTDAVDFSDMPLLMGQVVHSAWPNEQNPEGSGYLLTELLPVASAKKCQIYQAFRADTHPEMMDNEHPFFNPLVCKLSANLQGMYWESEAYRLLDERLNPEERQAFVEVYDAIPATDSTQERAGLIMEKGLENLRFQIRNKGAYRGETLRQSMQTVIFIVHTLHSHGLVWTELKAENFVMTNTTLSKHSAADGFNEEQSMFFFGIKGIDLESVIPAHDWLRVYTAEACPPEFPVDELYKSLPKMRVDPSFDMWGLGLVLYEMATGKPFYAAGLTDLEYITNQLRFPEAAIARANSKLLSVPAQPRKLIQRCMSLNPEDRPSCLELLQDPYFQLGQSILTSMRKETYEEGS